MARGLRFQPTNGRHQILASSCSVAPVARPLADPALVTTQVHACTYEHVTLSCSPHPQIMAPQVAIVKFDGKWGKGGGGKGIRQPRGFIETIARVESEGSKQTNQSVNHCFITYTSTSTFTSTSRGTGKTASENGSARVISDSMSFLILGHDMPFSRRNTLQVPTHRHDKQK